MNKLRWPSVLFLSAFVLLLGFIAGKIIGSAKTADKTPLQSVVHEQSKSSKPLEKNAQPLQATTELSTQSSASSVPASLNTIEIQNRHYITVQADMKRIKEHYAQDPYFNLMQENENKFLAQAFNAEWALPREAKLAEIISQDKDLHNLNLKAITCRSSYCRIQIYFQTEDETHSIPDQVNKSMIGKIDQLLIPSASADFDRTNKTINFYMTDDPEASLLK